MRIPDQRIPDDLHWVKIPEFPNYSVSHAGHVLNHKLKRLVTQCINQSGLVYVGLVGPDRVQHKRSVPLMVACAFLPLPDHPFHRATFDTPINVDGNRFNNHVENLMWRPRWFASAYHKQAEQPAKHLVEYTEVSTGRTFKNSMEVAMAFGLLEKDVFAATWDGRPVWPTNQVFVTKPITSSASRGI